MKPQETNLNLNYLNPTVSADGNVVLVTDNGLPTVIFFQARGQQGSQIQADVVASVRFHNLQELKDFAKAINDTVKKHEDREP